MELPANHETRLAVRQGMATADFVSWLRVQAQSREVTKEELTEFVRIQREHVSQFGGAAPATTVKPAKKASKKATPNIGDLLSELEDL